MDVVAESVKEVFESRENVQGLKMVYEPKYLRFFQARFEPANVLLEQENVEILETVDD